MSGAVLSQARAQWRQAQRRSEQSLAELRPGQRRRFEALRPRFGAACRRLRRSNADSLAWGVWPGFAARLEAELSDPTFFFLRRPVIPEVGFCYPFPIEEAQQALARLREGFPGPGLSDALTEDPVGGISPLIFDPPTSLNVIHHAYDLLRWTRAAGCELDSPRVVVEWGGGYGCMAKVFRRLVRRPPTYVIVDLPFVSALQWLYLAAIFGEERVRLLESGSEGLLEGGINLLPACFAGTSKLEADLFISTFGLNESSRQAHDLVERTGFFKARRVLLAYAEAGSLPGTRGKPAIAELAARSGLRPMACGVPAQGIYAFR